MESVASNRGVVAIAMTDDRMDLDHAQLMELAEARALTQRIRTATREVCLLLCEAHERRAWVALGHRSWEQYVQAELSLSRSRSYELLDQARVILELRDAAGIDAIPEVSAYLAVQIKPRIRQITQAIRQQVSAASEEDAPGIVANLLDEQRRQVAERRVASRARRSLSRILDEDNLSHFADAIELLTNMPAPVRTVELIEAIDFPQIQRVESALYWLGEFVEEWKRHESREVGRATPVRPSLRPMSMAR
jgi:hypothetical protein